MTSLVVFGWSEYSCFEGPTTIMSSVMEGEFLASEGIVVTSSVVCSTSGGSSWLRCGSANAALYTDDLCFNAFFLEIRSLSEI